MAKNKSLVDWKALKVQFLKTKPRTKQEMISYLSDHFRYHTMNSWNQATSYAHKVKITGLQGVPFDLETRMLDLLSVDGVLQECGVLDEIANFTSAEYDRYTAGFNGRSSGYLVLYESRREVTDYKSRCSQCHTLNYGDPGGKHGTCGSELVPLSRPVTRLISYVGRGFDMHEDFSEWTVDALRSRVDTVRAFDELAYLCVADFISYAERHHVEERTVSVPTTVRVAVSDDPQEDQ